MNRRAFLAALLASASASALGRVPYGGAIRLRVPWPVSEMDPHDLCDPVAAFFGGAAFDTLYTLDAEGKPYPTLAADLPEAASGGVRIPMRPGLTTARGSRLEAREVAWSLQRARRLGADALLARFGTPEADPSSPLVVRVPNAAPADVAVALSSPLTAVMSRASSSARPDGTGAFIATPAEGRLLLSRNPSAARGASFLERIEVTSARDLADGLRAFEMGEVDLGWLGAGLHRPRRDAEPFTSRSVGWIVLRTGSDAGTWGTPGIAQRLIDAIAPEQVAYLGLRLHKAEGPPTGWGGTPARLLVLAGAAYLAEVARIFAAVVSRPGHEISVTMIDARELRARRSDGRYALMIDVVRGYGLASDELLPLLAAVSPDLARRPPNLTGVGAEHLTRTLPIGVFGELRVSGAHAKGVRELQNWNLGAVYRE